MKAIVALGRGNDRCRGAVTGVQHAAAKHPGDCSHRLESAISGISGSRVEWLVIDLAEYVHSFGDY